MTITYRLLNTTDVQAFRQLRLEALQTHPEAFASTYDMEVTLPLSVFKERVQTHDHGVTVGAFDHETLIASCSFMRNQAPFGKHKGLLMGMYCSPNYQGTGTASHLLEFLINHARQMTGLQILLLGVVTTNEAAIQFYKKAGFTIYGTEEKSLYDGQQYRSEYLMQKIL